MTGLNELDVRNQGQPERRVNLVPFSAGQFVDQIVAELVADTSVDRGDFDVAERVTERGPRAE